MDCMMVVKEIVKRLLEEVEQDIDDEGEVDEEGEGGSELPFSTTHHVLESLINWDLNPSDEHLVVGLKIIVSMRSRTRVEELNEMDSSHHFINGTRSTTILSRGRRGYATPDAHASVGILDTVVVKTSRYKAGSDVLHLHLRITSQCLSLHHTQEDAFKPSIDLFAALPLALVVDSTSHFDDQFEVSCLAYW
ncbi:hypothetical protein Tco_0091834 [Tanacetum coccineum]